MGLLDGLKRNLNIGGPKVHNLNGPTVFSFSDDVAPLTFTLTGGTADAHVNSILLELVRERKGGSNNDTWQQQAVRRLEISNNGAGWDIAAGSDTPFSFDLPLNMAATLTDTGAAFPGPDTGSGFDTGQFVGKAAGFIQQLSQVEGLMHPDDRWNFRVKIDVANVAVDPGARIPTQLRNPGEFRISSRFPL